MKINLATLSILSALSLGVGSASASVVAYTEAGAFSTPAGYGGGGFNFTLSSSITITSLGFYALSIGDGDAPHVSLWNVTTSTLLTDSGNLRGTLTNDQWNYTTLGTPITLTPGDTYQVSAPAYFLNEYTNASGFSYGAEINAVGFVNKTGGWGGWSQAAPYTNSISTPAVSANFQYDVAVVPEPSVDAALLAGAAGLYLLCRRR